MAWRGEDECQLCNPVWQPAEDVDGDDGENEPGDFCVRLLLALRRLRILRSDGLKFDDHLFKWDGTICCEILNLIERIFLEIVWSTREPFLKGKARYS